MVQRREPHRVVYMEHYKGRCTEHHMDQYKMEENRAPNRKWMEVHKAHYTQAEYMDLYRARHTEKNMQFLPSSFASPCSYCCQKQKTIFVEMSSR